MSTPIRPSQLLPFLATAVLFAACRAPFEPDNGTITPPGSSGPVIPFKIGFGGPDFARAVVADGSGNAYVAGYFSGTVDLDPSSTSAVGKTAIGSTDISVVKYTPTGAVAWAFAFGGTDTDTPFDIKLGANGTVFLAGTVSEGAICSGKTVPNAGGHDILLMRLNTSGGCDWALGIGSSGEEEARAMMVEPSGDVVITGAFTGTVDFDPGPGTGVLVSRGGRDVFVARYSSDGLFKNVTQFGGALDDAGSAIARTAEGDLIVGGEFRDVATFGSSLAPLPLTSAGDADFFVARLSPQLGLQWAIHGGGTGADVVGLGSVAVDGFNRIWVAGTFSGVADLDPTPSAVLVTSLGSSDIFVARYDGTGTLAGVSRSIGGAGAEGVDNLQLDSFGNLYLAGWFQGSVDFDPTTGGIHLVVARGTQGAGDGYVLSLNSSGEFRWVDPIGSVIAGDANLGITSGLSLSSGSLWAVGRFYGQVTFDLTDPTIQALSLGDADMFVTRVDPATGVLRR